MIQVEVCIHLCAGGDCEKTSQDVVMATYEGTSSVVHPLQRLVQD